ncbi:MAG: hypothetical protein ACOCRU_00070 [bacterium]
MVKDFRKNGNKDNNRDSNINKETMRNDSKEGKKEKGIEERTEELEIRENELLKMTDELDEKRKEIDNQRKVMEEEKKNLESERREIEATKNDLDDARANMDGERAELKDEKEGMIRRMKEILERERSLEEREAEAEMGFLRQNEETLKQFREKKSSLLKIIEEKEEEIDRLDKRLSELRKKKKQEVDQEILKYRKEMEKELEKEYAIRRSNWEKDLSNRSDEYMKVLELRKKEMAAKEKNLAGEMEQITEKERVILKKEQEIKEKEIELENKKEEFLLEQELFEEKKSSLNKIIDKQVEDRIQEVTYSLSSKEEIIDELRKKIIQVENDLNRYETIELRAGQQSKKELLDKITMQRNEINRMKEERANLPSSERIIELETKAEDYQSIKEEKDRYFKENQKLIEEKSRWDMSVRKIEFEKEKREDAERRAEAVKFQIEKYKEEVDRLKSIFEKPAERENRAEAIRIPYFKIAGTLEKNIEEIHWLDTINEKCQKSGFKFNRRLINSFHTSLKTSDWSPLTVLAGVSGTGKSKLPELYSMFGGMYFLPLSVQPDWDSPQSIFGFFNSIDNKFNATPLLRTLYQSQDIDGADSLKDRMTIVLLDEMNLAHVELYFSDMLSKLEWRRGNSEKVPLDIDLGAGVDDLQINLSNNILWVGTMNEDETTKSLSDKVLDRGNLISFPRPEQFERRIETKLADESPMLARNTWDSWLKDSKYLSDKIGDYKTALEEINNHLENVGRALGHRVWQSVENYMANHPMVIKAYNNEGPDSKELKNHLDISFEDALVHKVMPKLRGIELRGNSKTNCLDKIEKVLQDKADGLVEDFHLAARSPYGSFVWRSAKYLEVNNDESK